MIVFKDEFLFNVIEFEIFLKEWVGKWNKVRFKDVFISFSGLKMMKLKLN